MDCDQFIEKSRQLPVAIRSLTFNRVLRHAIQNEYDMTLLDYFIDYDHLNIDLHDYAVNSISMGELENSDMKLTLTGGTPQFVSLKLHFYGTKVVDISIKQNEMHPRPLFEIYEWDINLVNDCYELILEALCGSKFHIQFNDIRWQASISHL